MVEPLSFYHPFRPAAVPAALIARRGGHRPGPLHDASSISVVLSCPTRAFRAPGGAEDSAHLRKRRPVSSVKPRSRAI